VETIAEVAHKDCTKDGENVENAEEECTCPRGMVERGGIGGEVDSWQEETEGFEDVGGLKAEVGTGGDEGVGDWLAGRRRVGEWQTGFDEID